jgi:hypothetical protein
VRRSLIEWLPVKKGTLDQEIRPLIKWIALKR